MKLFFPSCGFFSPLSLPPTVASGGQPHHAGERHHGSAGVMRERRAADDPYWSYSGELSFVSWPELSVGGEMYFFDLLISSVLHKFFFFRLYQSPSLPQ